MHFKNFLTSKNNLPDTLPFLDVEAPLLMPSSDQTLDIHQAQHINLIDYALQQKERLVAIVPNYNHYNKSSDYVGCAGRITSFIETEDGRYIINLTGICRFQANKIYTANSILKVKADWNYFEKDLNFSEQKIKNRHILNEVTDEYFNLFASDLKYNLTKLESMSDHKFISLLSDHANFSNVQNDVIIREKDINIIAQLYHHFMELEVAEHHSKTHLKH